VCCTAIGGNTDKWKREYVGTLSRPFSLGCTQADSSLLRAGVFWKRLSGLHPTTIYLRSVRHYEVWVV